MSAAHDRRLPRAVTLGAGFVAGSAVFVTGAAVSVWAVTMLLARWG